MIHFSRNPLMARVLTEMKYMRELGEGIDRMILEMEQMGLVSPVFEEFAFMVRVTLRNNLEQRGLNLPAQAEMTKEMAGLNKRQLAILSYLKKHKSINRIEYEKIFNVSDRTAKIDLQILNERGLIRKWGNARSTQYQLL